MADQADFSVRRLNLGAFYALMATVLFGAIASPRFPLFAPTSLLFYSALILYVVLASKYVPCEESGNVWTFGYFAIHLALFVGVCRLPISGNLLFLLAMPVVSQAASYLKWPGTIGVSVGYFFAMTFLFHGMKFTWAGFLNTATGIVPAFVFVIAFSAMAKNALLSRGKAECLASQLEAANKQLRANAEQNAVLAAANERNRIASDIHDGVGHYLTVVTVQLQAARALIADEPAKAEEAVAKAESMSRAALEDVRRSVGTLRSTSPVPPLPQALQGLIIESEAAAKLDIKGEPRRLPAAIEQTLFRAVQEGLTNVRKHAASASPQVILDFQDASTTRLQVCDDGQGCRGNPEGFGLVGLRERVQAVGGKFSARNRAERGFILEIEVPA